MVKIPDPPGFASRPDALLQGSTPPTERMHPTMPMPDPATGELKVDPEISLKAKGFDLAVSLFYSTSAPLATEWGYGRSASLRGHLERDGDVATITRGDFGQQYYRVLGGSGAFASSKNTGNTTTLAYASGPDEYTEGFLSGMRIVYKKHGGTRYEIDRVEDPSGNAQTYTYGTGGEAGLLKSVEVPGGNRLTLLYTVTSGPATLVEAIQDWGGRRWTMQYGTGRVLSQFTTPLGCVTNYGYTTAGASTTLLHTIEDPRGYRTTYAYDAGRRVVSMAAGTAVWSYDYNPGQTVEIWPTGARATYAYDDNPGNNVSTVRADGVLVTYAYDQNRMKVRETTPAGTMMSVAYDTRTG
ncbi:RHS repeat protein [bacterium]|nr:MAG: RHS repeat protein [bacterium]